MTTEADDGPVVIAAFRDLPQAEAARGLLEAHGIDAVLHDDKLIALNWFLSNAIGGVKLVVPAAQAGQAREILEEILEEIEQQHLAETSEEPEPAISRWSWMKVAVVALMAMLLAVAIGQSFATGRQRPVAAPPPPPNVGVVRLHKAGSLTFDGRPVDFATFQVRLAALEKQPDAIIWFWCEDTLAAARGFDPVAKAVIAEINSAGVPVAMSTEPDFSNHVEVENGRSTVKPGPPPLSATRR